MSEDRFSFGKNWASFLNQLDDDKIKEAIDSMRLLLDLDPGASLPLRGKRMLDAGSGSGLFSLAAYRLGAEVVSFDYDLDSVRCTKYLREQYAEGNSGDRWKIEEGSLLDPTYVTSLGQFDVVYCWGVAHHTGNMKQAFENLSSRVLGQGYLAVAIYNDELAVSQVWYFIKKPYQRLPIPIRSVYVFIIGAVLFAKRFFVTWVAVLVRIIGLRNPWTPFANWIGEAQGRGMNGWHDLVDWVGGFPFEVAKPEYVFRFFRDRGFRLTQLTTSGGHGCNEFVFQRDAD